MKVLIHGLGLHGGGTAAARYFSQRGCTVRVTDLRDSSSLKPSVRELAAFPEITWSLGCHREEDFRWADLVIKGPSVPWDSPYLLLASRIETDISWLVKHTDRELIVITGTKGKSTAAQLIHSMLKAQRLPVTLGGNMGISGFTLLEDTLQGPLVLELSSWQLRDLENLQVPYAPRMTVLTSIYPDHLDAYKDFSSYVEDKALAVKASSSGMLVMDSTCFIHRKISAVLPSHDHIWSAGYHPGYPSASITHEKDTIIMLLDGQIIAEIPRSLTKILHVHERTLLASAAAAHLLGAGRQAIQEGLSTWKPLPHRMEFLEPMGGITWINDSASTILESTLHALNQCQGDVHLIMGGSDKGIRLDSLSKIAGRCKSIHLLDGSFSQRILQYLYEHHVPCSGPFSQMEDAVQSAYACAQRGSTVLLSPGAASFDGFAHAYDRGERFRDSVRHLREENR